MNTKRWLILGAMLVAVGAAVWISSRLTRPSRPSSTASSSIGKGTGPSLLHAVPDDQKLTVHFFRNPSKAPALAMKDVDGRPISTDALRGKVVIVNFWATWCPPCRAEIPDLVALQTAYGDRLQIIGVSQDEGPIDGVKRFAADQRMNYPIVMTTADIEKAFPGVTALPTSFVLDREGRIVQRHVGMLNATLTEQETRALAGLPVNASIEEVDRAQPAKLENAQATQIPGVDLSKLSSERRTAALQKLNTEPCTCGCENTVAKCRVDDPKCSTSLPIAQRIVEEIAAQP
jgi:thiol-disulfide isomerase/thioredoxin